MARAIFGGVGLQGMSGSINKKNGGHTFQKNGVIRRRVIPSNPSTASQTTTRSLFSQAAQAWGTTLTEAQRLAWDSSASSGAYDFSDTVMGVPRRPTGEQAFISACVVKASETGTFSAITAPGTAALAGVTLTSATIDASSGTVAIAFSGNPPEDTSLQIRATAPLSPGRMKVPKSALRTVMYSDGPSPVAAGTAYVTKFGSLTGAAGKIVFVELEIISTVTGQKAKCGQVRAVVVA